MYLAENLIKKWEPVLNHESLPEIKDHYKRTLTAIMLENQENAIREQRSADQGFLTETTTHTQSGVAGAGAGFSGKGGDNVAGYDPIMISLVRRAMPQLIAYDVCGVQPMTGPTGLIFAMKSTYATQGGTEALFNEALTAHSGAGQGVPDAQGDGVTAEGAANVGDPFSTTSAPAGGMTTATAEQLGGTSGHFREMSFSIDKTSVTAVSRALKAEYTTELAQDLKAVHGLDAETELANILSTEILAEINREIIRTINYGAKKGAQTNVATQGTFDLDKDSNGRWSVEKFKGLMFQIERDANGIGIDTRRGRGNIIITSPDVASALSMAGVLDYNPAIQNSLDSDVTTNSFAGTLNGKYKVYVDPYFINPNESTNIASRHTASEYYTMGYKGTSPYDAGLFYCPYVPLQMVKAMGEDTFQPKIGFKTRYGVVPNPFVGETVAADTNTYYRKVTVSNLM